MATKAKAAPKHNVGKVVQVIGPVLDVEFEPERLPEIYNAVVIDHRGNGAPPIRLTAEVQQHIGRNQVRAVAMTSTDGVVRGMEVLDTGKPITVPVGQAALGRILNVLGEPVDEGDPIPPDAERWPIHRETPKFVDLEPKTEVFETGIKVIDLIAPFVKGGKIGLFGGAGVGKTVIIQDVDHAEERERPWGLSGCVTTATTSNPSPSRASREGTANSGVPKKTTRTQSSPAGSGVTSFTYPDCPLRDFFHLARSSPRFTALKWSRKSTPSRWSISCCTARALKPESSTLYGRPSRSSASSAMLSGRSTSP